MNLNVKRQTADLRKMPGAVLARKFKGRMYQVTVLPVGFEMDGHVYKSLTAVAYAITGSHWNTYLFFNLLPPRKTAAGLRQRTDHEWPAISTIRMSPAFAKKRPARRWRACDGRSEGQNQLRPYINKQAQRCKEKRSFFRAVSKTGSLAPTFSPDPAYFSVCRIPGASCSLLARRSRRRPTSDSAVPSGSVAT